MTTIPDQSDFVHTNAHANEESTAVAAVCRDVLEGVPHEGSTATSGSRRMKFSFTSATTY